MSKDPAILFYTSDFLTGTLTMTDAQKGKYITLLCLQHQQGFLTDNDMKNICKTYDEKIYMKFTKDQMGYYYNERMRFESDRRKKYSESRSKNRNTSKTYVKHMENEDVIEDNFIIDYGVILENYHLYCDKLSKVIKLSDQRKKHIAGRFKDFDFDTITIVLQKVGKSDFLNGANDRLWKADIDWIFNPTNFIKIMEGKYDNKPNGGTINQTTVNEHTR
jgi:hypothetical protein